MAIVEYALGELGFDKLLFIPTGNPHFKLDQQVTPAFQRVEMLRLALAGDDRCVLDTCEVDRAGVTYTADTLEELQGRYPDARLNFIIGADSALTLVHWRRAADLARMARFIVLPRPGVTREQVAKTHEERPQGFDLLFVEAPQMDISSSEVRDAVAQGADIDGLVPPVVARYITEHGLYRDRALED